MRTRQIPTGLELADDALDGPLSDPDTQSDAAKHEFRLACQQQQHVAVVGEERPVARGLSRRRCSFHLAIVAPSMADMQLEFQNTS